MFNYLITNSKQYDKLHDLFVRLGFISPKLERFIRNQTGTDEMKRKVYNVWRYLRKIEHNFKALRESVESFEIPIKTFIGAYDNIIPIENARKAKRKVPTMKIILVKSGHKMLTREICNEIIKELQ